MSAVYLGEDGALPEPGLELVEHDGDGLPLLVCELTHRVLLLVDLLHFLNLGFYFLSHV